MKLFRDEPAQARSGQWLGSVRLYRPLSMLLVTSVAVSIGVLLVIFALYGSFNRKVRLTGMLVPSSGALTLAAPQQGVLVQLAVAEGQQIKAGQVLMALDTEHQSLMRGALGNASDRISQQIEARKASFSTERALLEMQARQREEVLNDRIRTMTAELRGAESEIALQSRRTEFARTSVSRAEQLFNQGFWSASQVQLKQEELLDIESRLQSSSRTKLGIERDLKVLEGEKKDVTARLRTDLNQIERNQASLAQEDSETFARKSVVISAPYDGVVSALDLKLGQSIQTGQALATIIPTDDKTDSKSPGGLSVTLPLEAHLFAPSRTVGFVRIGQKVFIRYAAFPFQKFGLHSGRITSVSVTPFSPNELPANRAQQVLAQAGSVEALYRIVVSLDRQDIKAYGEAFSLRPGLTLEADVLQERRQIWEWLFQPLLATSKELSVMGSTEGQQVNEQDKTKIGGTP